eukprot:scaffold6288_cov131-Skeletonema_dohrnii-CCMP3373.AAC.2
MSLNKSFVSFTLSNAVIGKIEESSLIMATFYQSRRVPSSPCSFLGTKHHLLLKQTSAVTSTRLHREGDILAS